MSPAYDKTKQRPVVGITIGDPAGIGPEISLKSALSREVLDVCVPVLIGDSKSIDQLKTKEDRLVSCTENDLPDLPDSDVAYFLDLRLLDHTPRSGVVDGVYGEASGLFIKKAVELAMCGKLNAIATAPINKESFNLGGFEYPGHTEFLAHLTNTEEFAMSFFAGELRVVLLSTHLALREAIELVKTSALVDLIRFTDRELGRLLKKKPKIALAGLNPHASENGKFGNEEALELIPAVGECREILGIDIHGPYSADTIFIRGFQGEFDAVISCYHDQATIAVKCLSFGKGVNVTLGLPIIRTSVDHGTAFDIAGKGLADSGSMIEAVKLAAELAYNHSATA